MTLSEYELRLESYELKQVQERQNLALSAWLNQQVKATTGSGTHTRPYYRNFTQFFDVQYEIDKVHQKYDSNYQPISKKTNQDERQNIINKRINEMNKILEKGGNHE